MVTLNYMVMKERHIRMVILGAVTVLIVGGSFYALKNGATRAMPVSVPQDFIVARQSAATISQSIVNLTDATRQKIDVAHTAQLAKDAARMEQMISEARSSNGEAYRSAVMLADLLKALAGSLTEVKSMDSQRIAYQAIAVELSLVSRFIVYTQDLNSFLDALARSTEGNAAGYKAEVDAALKKTNEGAKQINELNEEFLTRMEKFDRSLQ